MLGDYAVATSFDTFAARRSGAAINPRDGMASLAGSRFVRASESDEGTRFSEAQLKALTGGERIRTARMYQEDFDYRPTFKIWLSSNHEPTIRGTDDGIWRRIHRVNFNHVVPEGKRDLHLGEKLQADASGMLNWALAGLKMYQSEGLCVPQCVTSATTSYRNAQNLVLRFVNECTEKVDGTEIGATALYTAFEDWCLGRGERPPKQTAFGIEAKKLLQSGRDSTGRNSYFGVKLPVHYRRPLNRSEASEAFSPKSPHGALQERFLEIALNTTEPSKGESESRN